MRNAQPVKYGKFSFRPNTSSNVGKYISRFKRAWVFYLDGRECVYCGEPYSKTLDHIIPASAMPHAPKHIVNAFANLATACEDCNTHVKNSGVDLKPRFGRFARYQFMETHA